MKLTDEQMQEAIERGAAETGNDDDRAYRQVFAALERPSRLSLPPGFEDAVIKKINTYESRRTVMGYVWYALSVTLLVIAGGIAIAFTGLGFLKAIVPYAGIFIFGGLFILFLHILDRRLLHH